jgi:hypothetical protein
MASIPLCGPRIWPWWPLERAVEEPAPGCGRARSFNARYIWPYLMQGFKFVFTSPSSVDDEEPKATRSGNARIHGMTCVTKASLAYIATQVSFRRILVFERCWSFCRSGLLSVRLAHSRAPIQPPIPKISIIVSLTCFWMSTRKRKCNSFSIGGIGRHHISIFQSCWPLLTLLPYRKIFPHSFDSPTRSPTEGSALSRIKEKRRAHKAMQARYNTLRASPSDLNGFE